MHGEADDAPGLALLGILLIVGALAVAQRTSGTLSRRARATRHPVASALLDEPASASVLSRSCT
jgi:hypothetical protein